MEELIAILDPVAVCITMTTVIGMVELIKRLFDGDYRAAVTIVGAGIAGTLIALPLGIAWYYGLVLGIAGSGVVTIASKVNGVTLNKYEENTSATTTKKTK
ncbi:MAG: hypothetical protein Q4C83_02990 [Candidatus Saccharibacteria bacterium]|nr:hypothetical protein [Candidatus Saccharibacteria bacterium]